METFKAERDQERDGGENADCRRAQERRRQTRRAERQANERDQAAQGGEAEVVNE